MEEFAFFKGQQSDGDPVGFQVRDTGLFPQLGMFCNQKLL